MAGDNNMVTRRQFIFLPEGSLNKNDAIWWFLRNDKAHVGKNCILNYIFKLIQTPTHLLVSKEGSIFMFIIRKPIMI